MHWALFAGIWIGVVSLLFSTSVMVHQRYQRAMNQRVQNFEQEWTKVEQQYAVKN